ncbi:MAG: hypothetical protein HZB48_02175, partial [Actinobacteria bacterium]|nr:hypothetical protein [Actinomycetota bacterium]
MTMNLLCRAGVRGPLAALAAVAAGGLGGVLALGLAVRLLTRGRIVTPDRLPPLPVALGLAWLLAAHVRRTSSEFAVT